MSFTCYKKSTQFFRSEISTEFQKKTYIYTTIFGTVFVSGVVFVFVFEFVFVMKMYLRAPQLFL